MKTRTVKHKIFTYHVEEEGVKPDGSIGEVTLERQARHGETVEIRDAEAARGDRLGAFYTDQELQALAARNETPDDQAPPAPPNDAGQLPDLATLDEDATRAWLNGQGPGRKPSVPQVLTAVNNSPEGDREEVAQRVLDAERSRDSEERSSLVEPLEEFLSGGGEEGKD